jgi:Variant SH3 domain
MYNFNGENKSELSVRAGQQIKVAPREVQQMNRLLSTNWLLATADGKTVGVVPINYLRRLDASQTPPGETADITMDPILIKDVEAPVPPQSSESTC